MYFFLLNTIKNSVCSDNTTLTVSYNLNTCDSVDVLHRQIENEIDRISCLNFSSFEQDSDIGNTNDCDNDDEDIDNICSNELSCINSSNDQSYRNNINTNIINSQNTRFNNSSHNNVSNSPNTNFNNSSFISFQNDNSDLESQTNLKCNKCKLSRYSSIGLAILFFIGVIFLGIYIITNESIFYKMCLGFLGVDFLFFLVHMFVF